MAATALARISVSVTPVSSIGWCTFRPASSTFAATVSPGVVVLDAASSFALPHAAASITPANSTTVTRRTRMCFPRFARTTSATHLLVSAWTITNIHVTCTRVAPPTTSPGWVMVPRTVGPDREHDPAEPRAAIRRAPFSDNPTVGVRGQRTQQRILDAALRVFGDDGYHQCSIDRIAKRAGCSRVSFYQYFSGKE